MAELNLGKGLTAGKVASNVQKKLTRAQEKVRAAFRRVPAGEALVRPTEHRQRLQRPQPRRKPPQPPHRQCSPVDVLITRTRTWLFADEMPTSPALFSMSRSGHVHHEVRQDETAGLDSPSPPKKSIYDVFQAFEIKVSTILENSNFDDGETIPYDF